MLKLKYKNVFLKDRKLVEKRWKDLNKLAKVMCTDVFNIQDKLDPWGRSGWHI